MNTVTITGRMGADPEVRTEQDGRIRTSFSVADDQGKDKQNNERTNWWRCTAWGKTAEHIGNYFSKGRMITVTGQLLAREFTGKDGVNRTSLDLTVDRFGFCGDAKPEGQQPAAAPAHPPAAGTAPNYGPPATAPSYGPPAAAPAAPLGQPTPGHFLPPSLPAPPPGYRWVNSAQGPVMVPIMNQDEIPF